MKKKEEFLGYAEHAYNPIIRPLTEELLRKLVAENKPKKILEIGTFLGYSAAVMLEAFEGASVISLEKDEKNARFARENLKEFETRAQVLCCDAMDWLVSACKEKANENLFDFIFLDGAKGQYHKYLPLLKRLLRVGGLLVADDVLFYGLVQQDGTVKHKHRSIVENLRKFLNMLEADADFETTLHEFEDGVTVSVRKK